MFETLRFSLMLELKFLVSMLQAGMKAQGVMSMVEIKTTGRHQERLIKYALPLQKSIACYALG